ncbi:MAG: hypothetical protein OEY23_18020 [Acidimicrobiia bacterium]|nr:hypothetical protein [Acidimicrobiia bacterium]
MRGLRCAAASHCGVEFVDSDRRQALEGVGQASRVAVLGKRGEHERTTAAT